MRRRGERGGERAHGGREQRTKESGQGAVLGHCQESKTGEERRGGWVRGFKGGGGGGCKRRHCTFETGRETGIRRGPPQLLGRRGASGLHLLRAQYENNSKP